MNNQHFHEMEEINIDEIDKDISYQKSIIFTGMKICIIKQSFLITRKFHSKV
jgi:hypothetical protein